MPDWIRACNWFAEAAAEQALADKVRAAGYPDAADHHEWTAHYKEQIGMADVAGVYEAIEKGFA